MVYSELVDDIFCSACAVFCADYSKGKFVVQPFRAWNRNGETAKEHERCLYHQHAIEQADHLKQTMEKPHTTITAWGMFVKGCQYQTGS